MTVETSARLSFVTFITWMPNFGAAAAGVGPGSVMFTVAMFLK
jgi:hypothetical protein